MKGFWSKEKILGLSRGQFMSAILHLTLIFFIFFGGNFFEKRSFTLGEEVEVEIVSVNLDRPAVEKPIIVQKPPTPPKAEPKKEIEPPKTIEKPVEPPLKEQETEKETVPEPVIEKPKPKPITADLKESDDIKAPLPRVRRKSPPPQPKVAKKPPQQKPKPVNPKPQDNEFDSLLDSLVEGGKAEEAPKKQTPSRARVKGQKLSSKDFVALKQKVRENWNMPPGAESTNIEIILRLKLSKKAEVLDIKVVDKKGSASSQLIQATAFSVERAVLRSSPLPLPKEKYKLWKNIELVFRPNEGF